MSSASDSHLHPAARPPSPRRSMPVDAADGVTMLPAVPPLPALPAHPPDGRLTRLTSLQRPASAAHRIAATAQPSSALRPRSGPLTAIRPPPGRLEPLSVTRPPEQRAEP